MTEPVGDNPILNNPEVEQREEEKSEENVRSVSTGITNSINASSVMNRNEENPRAIDTKTDDNRIKNSSLSTTCDQNIPSDAALNSIPVQSLESDTIFDTIKSLSVQNYRDDNSDDNSDSSDSDSSSTVSEENEDSDNTSLSELTDKKGFSYARTKGELTLQDLPPIEDLAITVEESKCKPIGSVFNIVDTMVIVQSFPNTPPLDIDTVLFLDRGQRPLGKIFDVFGPVQEPLYCVRFNSAEHIKEKNITKEQVVYCAPQTEYTSFIHTAELMKNKGSDASWTDNNEPPVSCLDFSDDEEEARVKRSAKASAGSKREAQGGDNDLFVKKMNQRNLELTAKRKKEDDAKQKRSPLIRRVMSNNSSAVEMVNMNPQSCFPPFVANDNYKMKSRPFSNDSSRLANFHHNSNNTHVNKFDGPSQSVNYMVGGYSAPSNYTFPPQPFLCSSPRQLPNVASAAQNYLTVYSRPPMHSPMPPYSSFSSTSIPPLPSFPPQPPPAIHRPLPPPPTMHPPMPQFSNFNPMSALPLPTTMPQANFFPCADAPPVPQQAFIPMNVRPNLSASFHPQFVLPPPPPPPPPSAQHHSQQRDNSRPDRRSQATHQSNSFYPTSYNS